MVRSIPLLALLLASLAGVTGCGSSDPDRDDSDDGPVELSFEGDDAADEPRFSPDGATIAYIQSSTASDASDLAVMDTKGEGRKTLAPAGTYLAGAAWAPDGKQIYFASDSGISVVSAEGGAPTVAVTDFATLDPDVSPDGKSLVYAVNGGSLKLIDLANPTAPTDLVEFGTCPRFSPDGLSIAFESGGMIKLMVVSTGAVTDVVNADTYLASVAWFADGERLAITSEEGIEIVTLGETPKRSLVRDEFAAKNLDLSADGKAIVYAINGTKSIYLLEDF